MFITKTFDDLLSKICGSFCEMLTANINDKKENDELIKQEILLFPLVIYCRDLLCNYLGKSVFESLNVNLLKCDGEIDNVDDLIDYHTCECGR